jgi:aminoglycoside phosphotransferase (APT) family kinase protein
MSTVTQDALQAYVTLAYPGRVSDVIDITTGWECEVFSFNLQRDPPGNPPVEEYVLRLYTGNDSAEKCQKEFFILQQLAKVGYPAPQVNLLERDPAFLGKPFIIMERINGIEMWSALSQSPLAKQKELVSLFCALYVRLHQLDWHLFAPLAQGDPGANPYAIMDWVLAYGRDNLARYPIPGFAPAIDWLAARRDRAPCLRPVLAHFDYHPANLLVRADGSAVVIDWTASSILDARMDLGWTLLLISIYAGEPVRDFILKEYERLSGSPVEEIEIFEVIACLRRMTDILISVSVGPEALGMRPGAEKLMKHQCGPLQKVYDLFQKHTGLRIPEVEELIRSFMIE